MNSEELNKMLVKYFPNLKEKYLDEVSWQEGDSTGSHVVYGNVFTPYLVECINKGDKNEAKKAFDFLEDILMLGDTYSEEVVAFSVLESILYLFEQHDYLRQISGECVKKILTEFE